MIASLSKNIRNTAAFRALHDALNTTAPVTLRGIHGSLMAFVISAISENRPGQLLLTVADDDRAEQLRDDCALLLGEQRVRLFGRSFEHHAKLLDMTSPIAQVETLKALLEFRPVVVISSAAALAVPIPSPSAFSHRTIELASNTEQPFQQLVDRLMDLTFERKEFVEEYGDFAVRGGILDIYPFVGENPVRLEFWGDAIESIREFDPLSQRSIRTLSSVSIVASLTPQGNSAEGSENGPEASLFDYLQPGALLLLDEPPLLEREIDEAKKEAAAPVFDWKTLHDRAASFRTIIHTTIGSVSQDGGIDFGSVPAPATNGSVRMLVRIVGELRERGLEVYVACDTKQESDRIKELIEEELTNPSDEMPFHAAGTRSDVLSDSSENEEEECGEADDTAIRPAPEPTLWLFPELPVQLLSETVHSGFVYPAAGLALMTEHEIFGRLKRRSSGRKGRFKGFSQKELSQLRRGDFIVHIDYGIGRFERLQKIRVRGVETEVMKLQYADGDSIYVNLNFVNRVQKYSSQEGHVPTLTKLGSAEWDRITSRARKKVKDIARDLIRIYARRKHEQGFPFQPDTHWQKEMEASFMYEDTPDQATATADLKRDMESRSPMDRLICGDVGFGKTEVAVRGAFKAVLNGKQAAVLVPTTILAQQHYNTFVDRLGRYGVKVESLSRFRTPKEQKTIIAGLKEGRVDVVIGTHRLLSKDVVFKDLGLLVIDEEHRFGVTAKEKLRQLRATIDTLTLTATPIPRTLQFSLMGARDLSIISTPPKNRLPITTEIVAYDLKVAREAILRELHRGGQVYFIHDRINDMDEYEALLKERIPQARFRSAHGQMPGHELEKVMMDFMEKKFEVLICTKIIESGIDIPSVNTIIINRADRFGLAELYQLRGRVGRSNVQAFAYLFTPPLAVLPRQTLRRLQAIQEFTELGSGFNLAMRDLEIRGAGNMLGAEQSGFILEMGFEMYQRIVEEAVAELKQEEFADLKAGVAGGGPRKTDTIIETDVEALIPDIYIESDAERLEIYRRLYKADTGNEIVAMRAELKDRFGEYPEEVEHLFRSVEIRLAASRLGFARVELDGPAVSLTFPPSETASFYEGLNDTPSVFQKIMDRVAAMKQNRLTLKQEGKRLFLAGRIPGGDSGQERLLALGRLVQELTHPPIPLF